MSMTHPSFNSFTIMSAVGAAATGNVFSSNDFRDVVIQLSASNGAQATVKIQARRL